MRIKFHPATIIEVFPDGQIGMFFGAPMYALDELKIAMIKTTIQNSHEFIVNNVPPGEYRFYATHYNWKRRKTHFALKTK